MTYALMLLITIGGKEDVFVLDYHLTRDDCIAQIHNSETRAALFVNAEVSLACAPEKKK